MKKYNYFKLPNKATFKLNWLYFLIIFFILFISVGYSSMTTSLNISGEAKFRPSSDIRITNCNVNNTTNGGLEDYECEYSKNTIINNIILPNLNSTITYNITLANLNDLPMLLDSINNLNFNNLDMEYTLTNLNINGFFNGASNTTFQITYKYKDSVSVLPANTSLGSRLKLNIIPGSYTLTVNANGGTWSGTTPQNINYNATSTINNPVKTGHTFAGWTLSGEGSNINGTTFTMGKANAILAANWTINNYTLTVNANGGTWSGTTPQNINYNATSTIANPTRTGYTFAGWTVSGTGSSMNGTTFTMGTANATLTANWLAYSGMYTYTGSSTVIDDGSGNWRIKFLTSGTFTPLVNMNIDIFLVGGGASGCGSSNGGGGGGGGYTNTVSNINIIANTGYSVTVGSGGDYAGDQPHAGNASFFASYTALGGKSDRPNSYSGSSGGSGGGSGGKDSSKYTGGIGGAYGNNGQSVSGRVAGTGQGTTTCEFGQGTLSSCNSGVTLYAGGGGGRNALAGAGGGGNGYGQGDMHGDTNTGGGGGGGINQNVGVGGSGIVIVRNKR